MRDVGAEKRGKERKRRRRGKEEGIFALYDCRESLAYFTSPRKLLSLRCSRSLIIDFHVHYHKDTNDDGGERWGRGRKRDAREGCSSYARDTLISMVVLQLP